MRYARPATLAALILVAQSGCRTAGVDNLTPRAPVAAKPQFDPQAIVADHNLNAERIVTVSAKPSLTVARKRRPGGGAVDGNLALERPRNFRLEVKHAGGDVADIGSNDEKFWFWIKDNQEKKIYYCDYDESGNTPLSPAQMQPNWISEALGLRVITEEEASGLTIKRDNKAPDTLLLTHRPTRAGGETVTRMTVMTESTHRIKEHQLYAGEPKVLLARAVIEDYLELHPEDRPEETVYLPRKMKLEWARDGLVLDATFAEATTKINAEFSAEKRAALFVEDPRTGYERHDMAAGLKPQKGQTTLRETRPAPPAGVELGEPAPISVDGAMRTDRDPVAISEERTSLRDDLLGPALPSAPGPNYARPSISSRWKAASNLER